MKTRSWVEFSIQPAAGIRWLRNFDEVVLTNDNLSRRWALPELEADVWEWLLQGFSHQSILRMIHLINNLTEIQSSNFLDKTLAKWEKEGLIKRIQST